MPPAFIPALDPAVTVATDLATSGPRDLERAMYLFIAVALLLVLFLAVVAAIMTVRRRRRRGATPPPPDGPAADAWEEAGRRAEAYPRDAGSDG